MLQLQGQFSIFTFPSIYCIVIIWSGKEEINKSSSAGGIETEGPKENLNYVAKGIKRGGVGASGRKCCVLYTYYHRTVHKQTAFDLSSLVCGFFFSCMFFIFVHSMFPQALKSPSRFKKSPFTIFCRGNFNESIHQFLSGLRPSKNANYHHQNNTQKYPTLTSHSKQTKEQRFLQKRWVSFTI